MKIVVHTGELAEKISAASMALGKKNVKPILAGFLFEADGNSFRITATDLETGIRAPIKVVEGSGKLKCVVPGDLMLKLVKVLPDETATLSFQKDTVVVRSGSATYKLTTMSADEYPDVAPGVGGTSYTLNSSLLYNLIKKTIFAAAKEQYTYYLNGVMWEF